MSGRMRSGETTSGAITTPTGCVIDVDGCGAVNIQSVVGTIEERRAKRLRLYQQLEGGARRQQQAEILVDAECIPVDTFIDHNVELEFPHADEDESVLFTPVFNTEFDPDYLDHSGVPAYAM